MKKVLVFIFIALFLVSFGVAKQGQEKVKEITGKVVEQGLPGQTRAQNDSGTEDGQGTLTQEQVRNIIQERNKIRFEERTGQECPENCICTGVVVKCPLENGGREMTVYAGESGNVIVQVKGINMSTNVTLYKANNTFYGVFRDNETKAINYMPDKVREKIREKLRANLENETIELDEDGTYQMRAEKKSKLFGLFRVRERVTAQIDAETGEIIRTRGPWWGFLATDEPSEIVGEFCGTVSPTGRNECCQRKGFTGWDNESLECV